jgi:hypothetical protein
MAIQARQKLVSSSKYSIKCPYALNAEYITFHNTANDASAENEISYMIGNNKEVSFHFAIDDKEVVQGLPLNRNAWHTGDGANGAGNRKTIGIEVCYSKSGGDRYNKAEALAIKFIAQLLKERGWGIDRVRTHKSWTELGVKNGTSNYVKNCPHRVLDSGRWQQVLNAIQTELNALNVSISQPTPQPSIVYEAHVQEIGWQGKKRNGETAGTTGQSRRLEALTVKLEDSQARLEMEGHIEGLGWTSVRTNGEVLGTIGEGLRLEAIKIKANGLNIMYRVHVENIGWTDWNKNGEVAGTTGQAKRIEAIEIKLV